MGVCLNSLEVSFGFAIGTSSTTERDESEKTVSNIQYTVIKEKKVRCGIYKFFMKQANNAANDPVSISHHSLCFCYSWLNICHDSTSVSLTSNGNVWMIAERNSAYLPVPLWFSTFHIFWVVVVKSIASRYKKTHWDFHWILSACYSMSSLLSSFLTLPMSFVWACYCTAVLEIMMLEICWYYSMFTTKKSKNIRYIFNFIANFLTLPSSIRLGKYVSNMLINILLSFYIIIAFSFHCIYWILFYFLKKQSFQNCYLNKIVKDTWNN